MFSLYSQNGKSMYYISQVFYGGELIIKTIPTYAVWLLVCVGHNWRCEQDSNLRGNIPD